MNIIRFCGPLTLSLLLVACGENQNAAPEDRRGSNGAEAPAAASEIHSASGKVTAIAGNQMTIAHGPVEGLGWPAMTMTFTANSRGMIRGIAAGDQVSFEFRREGGDYTLISLTKDG